MPDLRDGETVQVQGSASKPYVLKNVAGVFSCSCPAWRNQSLPIDRRTCKHLRQYRGDSAEALRLGNILAALPTPKLAPKAPPLLLAETWTEAVDPTGWLVSEKLDGVRCYWDGTRMWSRQGNRFFAPDWFTAGLPLEPLDGELWIGRRQFQRTVSIVRRQAGNDLWREMRFLMFDAPAHDGPFEERLDLVQMIIEMNKPQFAVAHTHERCQGPDHLQELLANVIAMGGEGLMLRRPMSKYQAGRSSTLLKVKRFLEADARVVGRDPGSGRHKGRLGALLVEMASGVRFCVGTGFSDSERMDPPPIGSLVTFRYQELSDGGVPRFPSFVRVRSDVPNTLFQGEMAMIQTSTKKRRFEFIERNSSKFWEIEVSGTEVHIQFGRIGTAGQAVAKSFADQTAATRHAEKVIREKIGKGYTEVPA